MAKTFQCMQCGFPHVYYQHCKIRCSNCGFMLDCSDLDVGGEVKRAHHQAKKQAKVKDSNNTL